MIGAFWGAVFGFVGRDYLLSVDIRRREARMLAEFPSLAELMALAVSGVWLARKG